MTTKSAIDDFVSQRTFAIVGVSRSGKKFGNNTFRELTSHGYKLYPIHPEAETLEGVPAYKDFASLPEKVNGVIVIVPPAQTEKVVQDAAAAGIKRIWMQQGAQSDSAARTASLKFMASVSTCSPMTLPPSINSIVDCLKSSAGFPNKDHHANESGPVIRIVGTPAPVFWIPV